MRCPCGYSVFGRDQQLSIERGVTRWRALAAPCCDERVEYSAFRVDAYAGQLTYTCVRCRRVREARPLGIGTALSRFAAQGFIYVLVSDVVNPEGAYARMTNVADPTQVFDVPARLRPAVVEGGCVIARNGDTFVTEEGDCIVLDDESSTEDLVCYALVDNSEAWLEDDAGVLIELECEHAEATCFALVDEQQLRLEDEAARLIESECVAEDDSAPYVIDAPGTVFAVEDETAIVIDEAPALPVAEHVVYVLDAQGIIFGTELGEDIIIEEDASDVVGDLPAEQGPFSEHPAGAVFAEWSYELPIPPIAPRGPYRVVLFDRYLGRGQNLGIVEVWE